MIADPLILKSDVIVDERNHRSENGKLVAFNDSAFGGEVYRIWIVTACKVINAECPRAV
jgi:hypothetical protein